MRGARRAPCQPTTAIKSIYHICHDRLLGVRTPLPSSSQIVSWSGAPLASNSYVRAFSLLSGFPRLVASHVSPPQDNPASTPPKGVTLASPPLEHVSLVEHVTRVYCIEGGVSKSPLRCLWMDQWVPQLTLPGFPALHSAPDSTRRERSAAKLSAFP